MILFVDGVDGSGKSTLIDGLFDQHAALGTLAVLAPPLWTFLAPINTPEDFAGWVQRTPGVEIARHLITSMCRRVDKLRTDLAHGATSTETLVVVDRGPKTTVCSALAHASTGKVSGQADGPAEMPLAECIGTLEGRVACLTASMTVAAVELVHPTPELVLRRLALIEELSPAYERYLRAFSDQMSTALPWPGIRWFALPADADVASNLASANAWVQRSAA